MYKRFLQSSLVIFVFFIFVVFLTHFLLYKYLVEKTLSTRNDSTFSSFVYALTKFDTARLATGPFPEIPPERPFSTIGQPFRLSLAPINNKIIIKKMYKY